MTNTTNTPRLLQAAKEFNIGKETLVEFLLDKGFEVNANPSTKLTPEMYKALQVEFAQDKLAKRKSDEIALPKGLHDNSRKPKDTPDLLSKIKKEEPLVPEKPKSREPEIIKEPASPVEQVKVAEEIKPKEVVPVVVKQEAPKVTVNEVKITESAIAQKETPPESKVSEQAVAAPAAVKPAVLPEVPPVSVVPPAPIKPVQEQPLQEQIRHEQIKQEQHITVEKQVSVTNNEKSVPLPGTDINEDKDQDTDDQDSSNAAENKDIAPEHIELKAPRLDGPNILGKINLDEINMASRPKKGYLKTKEAKNEKQVQPKRAETPGLSPKTSQRAQTAPPSENREKITGSASERLPEKLPEIAGGNDLGETAEEEDSLSRPDHIEMKAPRLEGPKIIGKIELPVSQQGGQVSGRNDRDRNEKRKRKRIPVDKKPESFKPEDRKDGRPAAPGDNRHHGTGDNRHHGQGDNRPRTGGDGRTNSGDQRAHGTDNRGAGTGNARMQPAARNDQRHGGGNSGPGNRPGDNRGHGRDNRPGDRRREPLPTPMQQEIDAKAIQEKIRETQAKLSGSTRGKNLKSKYRRSKRDEMAEKRAAAENAETTNVVQVTEFISVSEFANLLNVTFAEVISKCMSLGIMVSINQRLDAEIIELVAGEFGFEVEFINLEQTEEEEEEEEDDEDMLLPRAPIVTIMGHVDHGKTSLLDYIRSANVVAGEAGGITQHIGAYQVTTANNKKITFLDTPGHEAFTAMRARGAKAADVAVIVIAADDAIMPQTREAISHAQAANLPMIFAINKIDKPGSNPEKIKEQLANMNILVEDWGGKFQCQEISAKKGVNIDILLEKILLEADLLELRANPERSATGSVIEASLDKGRGYQTTILVQNGTLNQGEMIVCGQYFGKIKAMFNERGQRVKSAIPSTPVQVLGLNGAPQAGEKFKVYEDEDKAKEVANHRAQILREQGIRARKHITLDEIGRRLALGNFKELGIIIKGDFDGSVEALSDSLQKLSTEEVAVRIVHKAVGQITESDVLLATASDAIIVGFQVRPSIQAARLAEQENIEIRSYSIIYDAIKEIKSAMEGLLEPKVEKKTVCNVEVRDIFKISGVGTIAGCYVLDGKLGRNTRINIIRDGIVVFTGELASLKRFKDDAKEVAANYECGLSIKNYNDVRVGDIIEGYEEVEVKRTL